jgi:hypothetical protein
MACKWCSRMTEEISQNCSGVAKYADMLWRARTYLNTQTHAHIHAYVRRRPNGSTRGTIPAESACAWNATSLPQLRCFARTQPTCGASRRASAGCRGHRWAPTPAPSLSSGFSKCWICAIRWAKTPAPRPSGCMQTAANVSAACFHCVQPATFSDFLQAGHVLVLSGMVSWSWHQRCGVISPQQRGQPYLECEHI